MKEEYSKLYETGRTKEEALDRLSQIVKVLRLECPWDKVQTHESLRKCMVEEAYEVVEAINNKDRANLREELGDVMLQVVFHSLLAEEEGDFHLTDVINEECEKMIRRHPHIFLEENVKGIDKVLEKWENVKSKEHSDSSITGRLERVPKAIPSIMRSQKVQDKASQVGFDWPDSESVFPKVEEELGELRDAMSNGDEDHIREELGDLLFSIINLSRHLKIDPEESLNNATEKFIKRFSIVEMLSKELDEDLESMSLEKMDELWKEAKTKKY